MGLVISFLISVLLYKEKFTRRQLVSVVIGIVAVILINL
jgi:multidrug transporter EmrE-like cation transporter